MLQDWSCQHLNEEKTMAEASQGRIRWLVLGALFIQSAIVNKLAQKTTQTAPFFAEEMDFGAVEIGELNAAWMLGTIPISILTGFVAARFGARRVLIFAGVLMCVVSPAMAFVQTYEQIYALNILSGACLGLVMPAGSMLIARWFPAREVAGALGMFLIAGALVGIVLNPMYLWITEVAGWRNQSLITSILAVLGLALVTMLKNSPADSSRISGAELHYIQGEQQSPSSSPHRSGVRALLTRPVLLVAAAMACVSASAVQFNWLWYAVLNTTDVSAGTLGWVTSLGFLITGGYALVHGHAIRTWFRGHLNTAMSTGAAIAILGFLSCAFVLTPNWVAWSMALTLVVMLMTPLCIGTGTAYLAIRYGAGAAGSVSGIASSVGLVLGFSVTTAAGNWVNPAAVGLAQFSSIWVVAAALCIPMLVVPWLVQRVNANTDGADARASGTAQHAARPGRSPVGTTE